MSMTDPQRSASSGVLGPGVMAPDFTLTSEPGKTVSLGTLRGQAVILAFYPADWSPVCGDQMAFYNEILPEFQRLGAALFGISVDGEWCHAAFARDRKLEFPCSPTSSPRGPSRAPSVSTATLKGSANGPCS